MEKGLFPIGKVVKPHGVKGKIKVDYFGDNINGVSPYREVYIQESTGRVRAYEILETTLQHHRLILRLKGIERREEAELLTGREVLIKREALPDLEKGEYYWVDILGMVVETSEGKRIGKVKGIFPTGANDVYVVEGKRGEIFLPATEEVIRSIDREKEVMKVVRMEGLWEEEDEV